MSNRNRSTKKKPVPNIKNRIKLKTNKLLYLDLRGFIKGNQDFEFFLHATKDINYFYCYSELEEVGNLDEGDIFDSWIDCFDDYEICSDPKLLRLIADYIDAVKES